MFFISRGSVRVTVPETEDSDDEFPEETYIISLGAGSFFGEVALLDEVGQSRVQRRQLASFAALRAPVAWFVEPNRWLCRQFFNNK